MDIINWLRKTVVPGRDMLPDGAATQPLDHEVARLNAQQDRADVQFGPGDAPPAAPLDASPSATSSADRPPRRTARESSRKLSG